MCFGAGEAGLRAAAWGGGFVLYWLVRIPLGVPVIRFERRGRFVGLR